MITKKIEYITRGSRNKGIEYLNNLVNEGETILNVEFVGNGDKGKIVVTMEDKINQED